MASRSLGTLTVDLVAKVGGFTKGMSQAERQADKSSKAIQARMRKIAKGIDIAFQVAAAAAVASFGALSLGIGNAVNRMDDIAKASQKVGITTESFSKLAYAADLSGVSFEQLEGALAKLAKSQDMAAQGSKEQLDVFKALGVEFKNADGTLRDTDQVLADIADRFQGLPDGANKTAAAMALLGRSGSQLIPLLNGGSEGLEEMGDELARFGGVVGPDAAAQAELFNDNVTRLQTAANGLWQALAIELLPDLVRLTEEFLNSTVRGNGLKGTVADVADGIRTVGTAAQFTVDLVQGLTLSLIGLYNVAKGLSQLNILGVAERVFTDAEFSVGEDFRNAGVAFGMAGESFDGGGEAKGFDFEASMQAGAALAEQGRQAATAEENLKRLAEAQEEQRKAQERATAARKAASEAAREQAEREKEAEKIREAGRAALESMTSTVQANAAALEGPAAQAARAYADELMRLVVEEEKLRAAQMLNADAERELSLARTQAFEQYQQELEALEEQRLGPGKQLLDDLKFELELMKMTNAERATAIQLRGMDAEAVRLYGDEIRQANEDIEESLAQIRGQDFFRDEMKGLFTDVVSGAKSAKDAVSDFFDNLRMRAIEALAERLMDQLFGQQGTTQTGAAGGGWASWIGALFGGARAAGGPVQAGKAYLVGEQGPELIRPVGAGVVVPAGKTAAMRGGMSIGGGTIVIQGATSTRSLERIRIDRERSQRRAVREMS